MPDELTARPERKATIRLGQRELSRISLAVILIDFHGGAAFSPDTASFSASNRSATSRWPAQTCIPLSVAFSAYAQDWNGQAAPCGTHWQEEIAGYVPNSGARGASLSAFSAPGDGAKRRLRL